MTTNIQPIEKRVYREDGALDVHHLFQTIQGEGPFTGTPATFIRLAGCNLQCPGCDTDYTSSRALLHVDEIVQHIGNLWNESRCLYRRRLVVITGGEPLRQNIGPLINELLRYGYYVQIETNGTLPVPNGVVFNKNTSERLGAYIVCSPKTGKINPSVEENACALKYVLSADSVAEDDGLPLTALGHTAKPRLARPSKLFQGVIYVQPMDAMDSVVNRRNTQVAINTCKKYNYVLQLQTHKLIGLE